MKRIVAVLLLLVLAIPFLASEATAQTTDSLLHQIIQRGKINVAVFSDVPPLGYMARQHFFGQFVKQRF